MSRRVREKYLSLLDGSLDSREEAVLRAEISGKPELAEELKDIGAILEQCRAQGRREFGLDHGFANEVLAGLQGTEAPRRAGAGWLPSGMPRVAAAFSLCVLMLLSITLVRDWQIASEKRLAIGQSQPPTGAGGGRMIAYNDMRVSQNVNGALAYFEGTAGALAMLISGALCLAAAGMKRYRLALAFLILAISIFALRSMMGSFFNDSKIMSQRPLPIEEISKRIA